MPSQIFRDDILTGQVALVTGGGSGIGAAIARELVRCGAQVVIASRKQDRIDAAAAGLSAELGAEVVGMVCDIRDREAVKALVDGIMERFGRLDILVNNGGGQFLSPAFMIRDKGWDAVIQTNLTGTWNLTRAVADAWMLDHGGRVVNITMLTRRGFPGMAHSVAARAGVEAMTKTLAVEWAPFGISLNCVQPGIILSSGMKNYPNWEQFVDQTQREIPVKRLGSTADIAHMVAYLAGPGGDYITGQVLTVDGGRDLWGETWPLEDPEVMPGIEVPVEPWEESKEPAEAE